MSFFLEPYVLDDSGSRFSSHSPSLGIGGVAYDVCIDGVCMDMVAAKGENIHKEDTRIHTSAFAALFQALTPSPSWVLYIIFVAVIFSILWLLWLLLNKYWNEKNEHLTTNCKVPSNTKQVPKSDIPFVGARKNLLELQTEYANETIRAKIAHLHTGGFATFRAIRGDGNCFYRALGFLLFEDFKQKKNRVLQIALQTRGNLVSKQEREKIARALKSKSAGVDSNLLQALVRLLRMQTSYALRNNELYRYYFDSAEALDERCKLAEKMGEEAEHMEINALLTDLGIGCQLIQLDRNSGPIQTYTLPDERAIPNYFLLYRPGHYDIMYKRNI